MDARESGRFPADGRIDAEAESTPGSGEDEIVTTLAEEHTGEEQWDIYDDDYDSWDSYNEDYSPCDNSYYRGKAVSRNILASDIGLISKQNEDKSMNIYVNNMLTTEPMDRVEIAVLDYTN